MKRIIALMGMLLVSTSSHAIEYKTLLTDKSQVGFVYKQMGVTMDGKFKRFAAQLSVDPAKPQQAKASIEVDLASIDTGTEADQEVQGKPWFNSAAFPKASFVASQIKRTGPQEFEVVGKLTIKGKTVDLKFPLQYAVQGNSGVFKGSFVIRRADFNIGEGTWAKFDVVANDIQVNFQLTAQSGK